MNILFLGASYGSLFATKCLMAGHDATLVCRSATAALINRAGTEVRIKLKGEASHRSIHSDALPGKLNAATPEQVDPAAYDLVVLAMQEPQYGNHSIRTLLALTAAHGIPCLSLMNMPPLPYIRRLAPVAAVAEAAYNDPRVWDRFDPALVTLCSPDPQAFRPADEPANVLQVGLATNFKAATFPDTRHAEMLEALARDIEAVRLDGQDVPVKLKVHSSPFVPLAKWPMLLAGNYRSVGTPPFSIRDAVHGDIERSRDVYETVGHLVQRLGGDAGDLVPFEKYAEAAQGLAKPSSVARALAAGAPMVERVDRLVQAIGRQIGIAHPEIDATVARVDDLLRANRRQAA